MKALTWREPFGTLMLYGKIETRKWKTNYRGEVLICCGKQLYTGDQIYDITGRSGFKDILEICVIGGETMKKYLGKAIAVGNLVDCRKMTKEDEEKTFVKYNPNLWCHIYENVRRIEPIPFKGKQGWSNVDEEIIKKIKYI